MPKIAGTLTPVNENVAQLGERVMARRRELGLSQVDVWQAGGPSNSTLTGIENGIAESVSASTLRKLDRALQWQTGSAAAVLHGDEPVVAHRETDPDHPMRGYVQRDPRLVVPVDIEWADASDAEADPVTRLVRLADAIRDRPATDRLAVTVSYLSGAFNTARNQIVHGRVPLSIGSLEAARAAIVMVQDIVVELQQLEERQEDHELVARSGAGKSRGQQIRDDQDASSD